MVRTGLAVLVAFLLVQAPATAESSMVVMDANEQILGELFQLGTTTEVDPLNSDWMIYRYGPDESMLVKVGSSGLVGLHLFFESSTCSGQAWMSVWSGSLPGDKPFALGFPGGNGFMNRLEAGLVPVNVPGIIRVMDPDTGACVPTTMTSTFLPVVPVDPVPSYQTPLRYSLNPSIFWDQFQTGDLSRWSNY